jgi:hypothetical protein
MGLLLLMIVILLLAGGMPTWGYSRNWGYGPSSVLGLVLVIVLGLLLLDVIHFSRFCAQLDHAQPCRPLHRIRVHRRQEAQRARRCRLSWEAFSSEGRLSDRRPPVTRGPFAGPGKYGILAVTDEREVWRAGGHCRRCMGDTGALLRSKLHAEVAPDRTEHLGHWQGR